MIYENDFVFIEKEDSQIPWVKIFTKENYKELSDCPTFLQNMLFQYVLACELSLREYYNPEKINIASFANYVPRVHFHVMARFKEDGFFPESMWGKQQREIKDLNLPDFEGFTSILLKKIKNIYV
ncbi:HIT family protein [Campylobacter sp. IFREMER_LSEM_CL1846]|uniref:HIT family protein n=1 Tax=Campylobacter sp. IFREMER_LSEM_CL1846 TaxID=2911614 RepID=UPI0021E6C848|nr:HIT family protein [Campylobacter sp. IFREMER_LSEM_CL1846]HEC1748359.1 HIT family protein [Campylobacter lari]MCV3433986.1 HIT family protein [Campylobacter sp. IFREMER_LSEM_CL1846]HEC1768489.1 HIT family protein [Campylobacter lari]HEC1789388.1 HIT family protein [Campylobacter lari]HEC1795774.1 HIT family protein [Campylobacter lari]